MDPVSITVSSLSIASSLFKASEKIYSFIKATKSIDRTIRSLQGQTNGLAKVLHSLGTILERPGLKQLSEDNEQLWQNVAESVQACQITTDRLLATLDRVAIPGSNSLEQGIRQLKLGLSQDEIDGHLAAIRTHSINLQLSVAIISVSQCASLPNTILNDQAPRFKRLEGMIAAIDGKIQRSSSDHLTVPDDKLGGIELDNNTLRLRHNARTIVGHLSSAVGRPKPDKTDWPSGWDIASAFDGLDEGAGEIEDSTTGSERGKPMTHVERAHNTAQITEWMLKMPKIDERTESRSFSPRTQNGFPFSDASIFSEAHNTEVSAELFDDSSDDDIDFDVAKTLLSTANSEFGNEQFADAESTFERSLEHCNRLKFQQQEALNLKEMKLKYAICKSHTGKLEESEQMFATIAKEPMHNATDAKRAFEALYGLATIHLHRRNLDAAAEHCYRALKGRGKTKTIGKKHKDYYACIKLYAIILWARGDKIDSKAYLNQLPEDEKVDVSEVDVLLRTTYSYHGCVEHTREASSETILDDSDREKPEPLPKDDDELTQKELSPTLQASERFASRERFSGERSDSFRQDSMSSTPTIAAPQGRSTLLYGAEMVEPSLRETKEMLASQVISCGPDPRELYKRPATPPTPQPLYPSQEPFSQSTSTKSGRIEDSLTLSSTKAELAAARAKLKAKGYHKSGKANEGLLWAAKNGRLAEVNAILDERQFDINTRKNNILDAKETPLFLAAERGYVEVCARLLRESPNLEMSSSAYYTPLAKAAENGHLLVCKLLLQHKANIEGNPKGPTPFFRAACLGGNFELCDLFLDYGYNINSRYKNKITALMMAATWKTPDFCVYLLERGARIDLVDENGRTALIHAAQKEDLNICHALLDYRANIYVTDSRGKTAVDYFGWSSGKAALTRHWNELHNKATPI